MGACASRRPKRETTTDWNKAYADELAATSLDRVRRSSVAEMSSKNKANMSFKGKADKSFTRKEKATAGKHGKVSSEGSQLIADNGYAVKKALGKGAFGEVFLASKGDKKFAIKVLSKSKLKKARGPGGPPGPPKGGGPPKRPPMPGARNLGGSTQGVMDNVIKTEIATMKKIAHPNCVHMFDVVLDPIQDEIFLVLEYVDGGPSQKVDADGVPIPLPEQTIWSHMRHLVLGLEYLHMHGIVHRDIKPENLLIAAGLGRGFNEGVLKIADFGTSCFCEGDANAQKTAGTPPFFAPELCIKETAGTYDSRVVDLWAVGVTVYVWCAGRLPFWAATPHLIMQQIKEAPPVMAAPPPASPGLGKVIGGLMTRDPAERLTLNNLRTHPWLTVDGQQPLPMQPVMQVEVTPEEVAQAFTNRAAIAYQSAAGPSELGKATGVPGRLEARGAADDSQAGVGGGGDLLPCHRRRRPSCAAHTCDLLGHRARDGCRRRLPLARCRDDTARRARVRDPHAGPRGGDDHPVRDGDRHGHPHARTR